ncbi:MAG: hypothetical protein DME26_04875, partial [Verrucomicrobia bacterium]
MRQKVYPQGVTGKVVAGGTGFPLTNAVVIVARFNAPGAYGAVADASGNFTVYSQPGSYSFAAIYSNSLVTGLVTVSSNVLTSQNFTSTPAPFTISGKVSDSSSGAGLPGIAVSGQGMNGFTIGFTDTNGNYRLPVTSGEWELRPQQSDAAQLGYVGLNDRVSTNVTGNISGFNFQLPKATALVYGRLVDNFGNPVNTIDFRADDSMNNYYQANGESFPTDGSYSLAVTAGNLNVQPESDTLALAGYVGPQGVPVSLINGQCVRVNFTVLRATNHITGFVKDNSNNPIVDINVNANATINGTNYQSQANTDSAGFYSLPVANGSWLVNVDCDGNDGLTARGYACVNNQQVSISNSSGVLNFTVQPLSGNLQVTTSSPLSSGTVNAFYSTTLAASGGQQPYTWSFVSGSLPGGLNLSSGGTISGTPNTAGTFSFTVRVSDNGSGNTTKLFSLSVNASNGADVYFYGLSKQRNLAQNDSGAPVLDTSTNAFRFNASVNPTMLSPLSVISASLTIAGGGTRILSYKTNDGQYNFQDYSSTQSTLDTVYVTGNYRLTVGTVHDGTKSLTLNLPTAQFPNAPHVSNFTAAQAINPAAGFVLSWDPFVGGTTADFISVRINDSNGEIFQTPDIWLTGGLDGTATSVFIPANTLSAGQTYQANISFVKLTTRDTNMYPGVLGAVGFTSKTTFNLGATGTKTNSIFPIATNSTVIEFGFSAAFDGTNYLVGIQGGPAAHDEITAQLFSPSGALIGSRFSTGRFGGVPYLAFDGANYLMVWQDVTVTNSNRRIYGQFLNRSGAPVGTPFAISAAPGSQSPDLDAMRPIAFGAGKYLVVWRDQRTGTNAVYGQLISPSGAPFGSEIVISADTLAAQEASVAFDGTNFLVAWQKRTSAQQEQYDTLGMFISPSGTKGPPFVISQTTSARHNPLNLLFNGTHYFVTWNKDVGPGFPSSSDFDIYGRFVSPTGSFPGNEIALVTGTRDQVLPGVAFDGASYLLSWTDGGFVSTNPVAKFQFLNPAAQAIGPQFMPFAPQGTNSPVLAGSLFDGSRFAVVATLANVGTNFTFFSGDVYGTFITPISAPMPPGILVQPISQTVSQGSPVTFSVTATGAPPLSYQWRHNGANIPGATKATYTIAVFDLPDAGNYTVAVANQFGAVESDVIRLFALLPGVPV